MLKKKERLTKAEFDKHFKGGKRYHSSLFTLVHSPTKNFHGAVVVGKKVHKKAVSRNRLRRQLYNLLYRLSRARQLLGSFIVLTKPSAKEADFPSLKVELEQVINRVGGR